MATAPTAEDSARRLLAHFAKMNQRSGEALMRGHVEIAFQGDVFRSADFEAGARYAHEKSWLQFDGSVVRLLPDGFAEM